MAFYSCLTEAPRMQGSRNSGHGRLAWFNVALPLVPILLVRFAAYLLSVNKGLLVILRDGQLCFFSSALAAVAVNDVVYRAQPGTGDGTTTGLAIIGLVVLIAFSMFVYGLAVVRDEVQRSADHKVDLDLDRRGGHIYGAWDPLEPRTAGMSKEGYVVDSTLGATSGAAVGALGTIVGSAIILGAAPAVAALVGVTALGAAAGAAIGALAHKSLEKTAAQRTSKPARRERGPSTAR